MPLIIQVFEMFAHNHLLLGFLFLYVDLAENFVLKLSLVLNNLFYKI